MIDLGTQRGEYLGEPTERRKVVIGFELSNLPKLKFDDGEKPQAISWWGTLNLGKKSNLRPLLESWRGKAFTPKELDGFDIEKLIGVPAQVQVLHKPKKDGSGDTAVIGSIMQVPDGVEVPPLENPKKFFSFDDKPSLHDVEEISEGLRKFIKESDEYKALAATNPVEATPISAGADFAAQAVPADNDVPF